MRQQFFHIYHLTSLKKNNSNNPLEAGLKNNKNDSSFENYIEENCLFKKIFRFLNIRNRKHYFA